MGGNTVGDGRRPALGLMKVIIDENLYDRDFVEKWTIGFGGVKEYVRSFTPEAVERVTGVPAKVVEALAREIAETKHVSLRTYTGLEYTNSGVQNIRAVFLCGDRGASDVPGGLLIAPRSLRRQIRRSPSRHRGRSAYRSGQIPLFRELVGSAQFMEFRRPSWRASLTR